MEITEGMDLVMTNADRIRVMSDEELSKFLIDFSDSKELFLNDYYCNKICEYRVNGKCNKTQGDDSDCPDNDIEIECIKYLKSEGVE